MIRLILVLILLFGQFIPAAVAGTCYGSDYCTACKNCNYCKHCNSGGSPCGVFKRLHGLSTKSPAPSPKPQPLETRLPISSPARSAPYRTSSKPTPVSPEVEAAYLENVRRRIQQSWETYAPYNAISARIYLEITKSGEPVNIKVLSSAGSSEELENAQAAIRCATPFGTSPVPQGNVRLVIDFKDASLTAASAQATSGLDDSIPPIAPPIQRTVSPSFNPSPSYPFSSDYGSGSSYSSGSSGGPVHVRGYFRKDGTYVRPHTRRRPSR
ncbi:MAG: TonB C-terminal domain-containing protein [Candidatus Obscuribacterales bacterium]